MNPFIRGAGAVLMACTLATGLSTAAGAAPAPVTAAPAPNGVVTSEFEAAAPDVGVNKNFTYSYSYAKDVKKSVSEHDMLNMAVKNFSTYFPFDGCGQKITVGQKCSLKFLKARNPIQVEKIGKNYFQFKSLPGHFEGANRHIKFTFKRINGKMNLIVNAWGPWTKNAEWTVESGFADMTWHRYANNLKKGANENLS